MNIFFLLVLACDNAKDGTSPSTSVETTTPDIETETAVDTGEVEESGLPQFESYISQPIASRLPDTYTSCSVIAEQQCVAGKQQVCRLYDSTTEEWAIDIPPMTEQAFWFDRYFDLYHQANGLSMDLEFTQPVFAGTPESEWSKPEYFHSYDGRGDASGWTGTALWGAAARYAVTGTAADYERMLGKMESMAFLYEVTSVPGLLARSHFAMLEEGAPAPEGHWNKSVFRFSIGDGTDGHYESQIAPELHHRLPDYYLQGIEIGGTHYSTTPMIQTDTSRDHYIRSMSGFMLAYDLLQEGEQEDKLRNVVHTEIPCTLNRMKKGRIYNLQQAPEILEIVNSYLNGPNVLLDEDDMEFSSLDTLVFYVLEQPHPLYPDEFDSTCPAGPPTEFDEELELDASDDLFLLLFAELAMREQRQGRNPIAWSMHVSVRASDVLFMTQWALTSYYLTQEQQYLDFLAQLMTESDYWGALNTYGAVQLPKWCASHYGPSIGYVALYNTLARINKETYPAYWNALAEMAYTEARLKENGPREDAFFGILYNRMVDTSIDAEAVDYVADAAQQLATYGMNPENKLEPDRSYPRDFVSNPTDEVPLDEITENDPEWSICEEPISLLGFEVPAPRIDGVPVRSVDPLPLDKRIGGTFLWQMDPWMVQRDYGGIGMRTQWPMLGMFTPYWVGRMDGVIAEGEGMVLAWQETEESCAE